MKPPIFDPSWADDVKAVYNHDVQEIWDPTICLNIWNQYHNQLDTYLALAGLLGDSAHKRILDVGCAQGTLALKLAELGHSVVAIDLRQTFVDYARGRYTHGDIVFLTGNVLEMEIPGTYDLIFANQIIEHLVYPNRFVQHLRASLRDNGSLVVTTPNHSYLRNSLPSFDSIGDPSQHEHRQFTADADGHFFAFRGDELERVFRKSAFQSVEVKYFETPFISGHMKLRYLHRVLPVSLLKAFDRYSLVTPFRRKLAHQLMVVGKAS